MAKDQGLEDLLKETFQVEARKAEKAAQNLTIDEFYLNFERLESILGFDGGIEVVKFGDFLDYRNSQLETYLQLAMTVLSKMDSSLPIPIKSFYSIESLKKYLGIKEKQEVTLDRAKFLNVAAYRLLHPDNPQSKSYLDSLIENGEITVRGDEHWNKGKQPNGPRGLNIIKKIGYDLTMIFNELGLGKPGYEIIHGQMKLTITDATTRDYLRQIRDLAYGAKR